MLKLGCYPGPSTDVGPAMTVTILTQIGQVFHRSTYRQLSPEIADKDSSMARVHERLESQVLPREFVSIGLVGSIKG